MRVPVHRARDFGGVLSEESVALICLTFFLCTMCASGTYTGVQCSKLGLGSTVVGCIEKPASK